MFSTFSSWNANCRFHPLFSGVRDWRVRCDGDAQKTEMELQNGQTASGVERGTIFQRLFVSFSCRKCFSNITRQVDDSLYFAGKLIVRT